MSLESPVREIYDLFRTHARKVRKSTVVKCEAMVVIGGTTVVARLPDGKWWCSNEKIGKFHYSLVAQYNQPTLGRVLEGLAKLKVISNESLKAHQELVKKQGTQRQRECDLENLGEIASRLGIRLSKRIHVEITAQKEAKAKAKLAAIMMCD